MKLLLFTIVYIVASLLPILTNMPHHGWPILEKDAAAILLGLYFYYLSRSSMRLIDWLIMGMLFFSMASLTYEEISETDLEVIIEVSFYFTAHLFILYIFKKEGATSILNSLKTILATLPPAIFGVVFFVVILLRNVPSFFILPLMLFVFLVVMLIILSTSRPSKQKSYVLVITGIMALAVTDFLWCINQFISSISLSPWSVYLLNNTAMYFIVIGVYENRTYLTRKKRKKVPQHLKMSDALYW